MKKLFFAGVATLCFLLCIGGIASATVLTFDDTSYQGNNWGYMDAGYGGFNWSGNFGVYYAGISPGYDAGVVSGDYAAFNSYGVDVSMSNGVFDWNGAWFNDPHNNTLLNVTGYLEGTIIYSANIQLSYASPQWFQADWTGIDTISFNVDESDWFTMDDFTFNEATPVPEPTSLILLGAGVACLAGATIRREKK